MEAGGRCQLLREHKWFPAAKPSGEVHGEVRHGRTESQPRPSAVELRLTLYR